MCDGWPDGRSVSEGTKLTSEPPHYWFHMGVQLIIFAPFFSLWIESYSPCLSVSRSSTLMRTLCVRGTGVCGQKANPYFPVTLSPGHCSYIPLNLRFRVTRAGAGFPSTEAGSCHWARSEAGAWQSQPRPGTVPSQWHKTDVLWTNDVWKFYTKMVYIMERYQTGLRAHVDFLGWR